MSIGRFHYLLRKCLKKFFEIEYDEKEKMVKKIERFQNKIISLNNQIDNYYDYKKQNEDSIFKFEK